MVKNPPSNSGEAGLIPGWGTKIPHVAGQLSLYTTTREKQTKTRCSQINKLKKKIDGGVEERGAHLLPQIHHKNTFSTCSTILTEYLLNTARRPQTLERTRKIFM